MKYNEEKSIPSLQDHRKINEYLRSKKIRDLILDFEHKEHTIYNFSEIRQINNLIAHGRMILLEISKDQENTCSQLKRLGEKYFTLFNYVCFSSENKKHIENLF